MLFNVTQSHIHGDKFKDKFDGPFYIYDIVRPETYKLRTIDGRVRKNPIHADLLKPYLERTEWELLSNNDRYYNIIKETYVVIIQMDITMEPTNFEIVLKELQTPITVLEKI